MPINVPANSIIEVTFEGVINGQTVMSVFHFYLTASNIPDFADFVNNVWGPDMEAIGGLYDLWRQCVSQDVTDIGIYFQAIWPDRYRYATYLPAQRSGARAGAILPQNVSASITKQCDEAGRGFIGTLHMPGLLTSDERFGLLEPAYRVLAANLAGKIPDVFIDVGSGAELNPCLWRRGDPVNSPLVTQAYLQPESRVMRRRTVRVGI